MKIGIIGAGAIGKILAKHLAKSGHQVSIANSRGPETLAGFANENGITAVSVYEAARENEIVILSIPQINILNLPADLFKDVSDEVIVIDTCNYFPLLRDGEIQELEEGLTDSQWTSNIIGRPVIKVFNSIVANSLANKTLPSGDPARIALSASGDNANHKNIVCTLLDQIGFDYYDNGPLSRSWRQQPGAPTYCMDFPLPKLKATMEAFSQKEITEARAYIKKQRKLRELNQLKARF